MTAADWRAFCRMLVRAALRPDQSVADIRSGLAAEHPGSGPALDRGARVALLSRSRRGEPEACPAPMSERRFSVFVEDYDRTLQRLRGPR